MLETQERCCRTSYAMFGDETCRTGRIQLALARHPFLACSYFKQEELYSAFMRKTRYGQSAVPPVLISSFEKHGLTRQPCLGLKTVIWIELLSLKNLPTIITVESVLAGTNAILTPMLAGFLSVRFESTRLLFHINIVLMILW